MVPMDQCHIDPVYKTIWLNAKQGNEFFTGSTDGTVRTIYRISLIRSRPCIILDANFLRLVLEAFQKISILQQAFF